MNTCVSEKVNYSKSTKLVRFPHCYPGDAMTDATSSSARSLPAFIPQRKFFPSTYVYNIIYQL